MSSNCMSYGNCHHLIVEWIIHMVGECRPIFQVLDMIKHDPNHLDVVARLYSFHSITPTTISMHTHLEQKHFLYSLLLWKITILNAIITIVHFALLEILYYVTIEFATTCDYLSIATMFYHFYN